MDDFENFELFPEEEAHSDPSSSDEDDSTDTVVFVYGTLKQGFHNHRFLQRDGAKLLGRAHTVTKYPMITDSHDIPYVLNVPGQGHNIVGELYAVNKTVLAALDKLEKHPGWYRREQIEVNHISYAERDECNVDVDDYGVSSPWIYMLPEDRVRAEQLSREFLKCYEATEYHKIRAPRKQAAEQARAAANKSSFLAFLEANRQQAA